MGGYFRVWKRLKNYRVALSFLLNYIDNMNMYFVPLVGWIATRIHDSSSLPDKGMVAVLCISALSAKFTLEV
jgi:hypothetical protein